MTEPEKPFTILVVDDEQELRNSIRQYLEIEDYNVLTAHGGIEALEVIKENHIDLILTDVRMPEGDGVTLLEETRKLSQELPVVLMMTGFAKISRKEAIQKGALDLLDKPINYDLLDKYVEDLKRKLCA